MERKSRSDSAAAPNGGRQTSVALVKLWTRLKYSYKLCSFHSSHNELESLQCISTAKGIMDSSSPAPSYFLSIPKGASSALSLLDMTDTTSRNPPLHLS